MLAVTIKTKKQKTKSYERSQTCGYTLQDKKRL